MYQMLFECIEGNKFYRECNKKEIQIIKMMKDPSLFLENVFTFKNLPVEQKQRKWTDCCCTILTACFALFLFVMSFITFTKYNYYQVNFPADDYGVTCYHQLPDYPFMFFENPADPTGGRYCLKICPRAKQIIQCQSVGNITANCRSQMSGYDTVPEVNKIGAFCSPADEVLRNRLFSQAQLGTKLSLTHGYDVVKFSLLMGFLVGLLYLAVVGCFPKYMTLITFVLAFLVLLASGIYICLRPVHLFGSTVWTMILAMLLIIFGIAYALYIIFFRRDIDLGSILIHHSNNFLKESYLVYFYIPLFLVFTIGFLVLIIWQFIAFGTANYPTFEINKIYYHSGHNIFLQILNVIELIWGLQFLRDAFNFIVSGNAVEWYFKSVTQSRHCTKPLNRLIMKHWGSVVGGSFLHAFLKVFDLFSDFFNCDPEGQCGRCQTLYEKFCCCNYLLDLVRTDAYSYINLTGIPYCNAARQCEALCRYSKIRNDPHFSVKIYRNASHIFVVGFASFISYVVFDAITNQYGNYDHFWIAAAIVFAVYSTSTYFVDVHSCGAEAILTCYLAEQNCEGEQYMQVCPGELRKDIYNFKTENIDNYTHVI